jgi:dethiobiotin synthetase
MPADVYVLTGVDTGVGKTHVAAGLLQAARRLDIDAVGIKPVESGCDILESANEDGARLAAASGQTLPAAALLRLGAPVAPPLAAEGDGVSIDFDALMTETRELLEGREFGLVEGAGGVLSPITWTHTVIDIARAVNARAIVVAADRLGMLNQVRLSVEALRNANIAVDAVVVSHCDADDASVGTNAGSLERISGMPPVFVLPHCSTVNATADHLLPLLRILVGR